MNGLSGRYAAIDLGSNSCRLLIADKIDNRMQHVYSYSRITRLSEGVASTGYISVEAQDRAIAVLKTSLKHIIDHKPEKLECVATEVCRKAKNSQYFLDRVKNETGLFFSIITEEQEANLAVLGLSPLFNKKMPYTIVFDVGGGSSEVVLVRNANEGYVFDVLGWVSIPMGVVSILETHNPESRKNYLSIINHIKSKLFEFGQEYGIDELIEQKMVQLIGASGTATTAACFHLGMKYYDREKIDGLEMSFEEVSTVIKMLQMMPVAERANHPCIGPERADLVLGGMAIFEGLSSAWPIGMVTVADRGVRDGVVAKMAMVNYD
jgi:exopolyphosphatase/guanosine-5'-triphosphate,3'-diphosphate pyrophosphatase